MLSYVQYTRIIFQFFIILFKHFPHKYYVAIIEKNNILRKNLIKNVQNLLGENLQIPLNGV